MGKELFEDGYFEKHTESRFQAKDGSDISKYLRVKSRPKVEEIPVEAVSDETEEMIEEVVEAKNTETWGNDFLKTVLAGFSGGFLVLIFSIVYFLGYSVMAVEFWTILVTVLIAFIVFFLIVAAILKNR